MAEKTKDKQFFTVARVFFLLIVIPISLMTILIANGIFKVGNIASERAVSGLDQKLQEEIKARAVYTADEVANFLMERKKDLLIATIIPATDSSFKKFVSENQKSVWVKQPDGKIVQEATPLYSEMTLIDKKGNELLKVAKGELVPKSALVNVAQPQNTTFKSEDYFAKAISLNKGDVYVSPVTGWYVNRADADKGKRFSGVIRFATPVFAREGVSGVMVLTLDYRHLAEFTNHIIPTQADRVYRAEAASGDFAYLVDARGLVVAHPNEYHVAGLATDGKPVAALSAENQQAQMKKGEEVLNVKNLGFMDKGLPEIDKDAAMGHAGSKIYKLGARTNFVAYAPINFAAANLPKPAGFGWVAMSVDVERFNELASATSKNIVKEAKSWTTTIIIILIISVILLFMISALLARGISRSIDKQVPEGPQDVADYYDDDDDEDDKKK